MKEIQLTNNKTSFVDDEVYEIIKHLKWYCRKTCNIAFTKVKYNNKWCSIDMHRFIFGLKKRCKFEVDHIDHNTLNNTYENLRLCKHSDNVKNRLSYGLSKYLGVSYWKRTNKWKAQIGYNKNQHHLGLFENEIDAAKAYDNAAKIHHGEFANLNFKNNN